MNKMWWVVVVGLGVACAPPAPEPVVETAKVAAAPVPAPVGRTATASVLYNAYRNNQTTADQRFRGEWYSITGFVDSLGKDRVGTFVVALETGSYGTVQCFLTKEAESVVPDVNPRQPVRIYGRIEGMTMTNVIVRQCTIEVQKEK